MGVLNTKYKARTIRFVSLKKRSLRVNLLFAEPTVDPYTRNTVWPEPVQVKFENGVLNLNSPEQDELINALRRNKDYGTHIIETMDNDQLVCPQKGCGKRFADAASLGRHLTQFHSDSDSDSQEGGEKIIGVPIQKQARNAEDKKMAAEEKA